jgi:uncharacterized DUF497 family protein
MVDDVIESNYNIIIGEITFSWDVNKNISNRMKHKISFEYAASAFLDLSSKVYYDPEHSKDEDRYILIGCTKMFEILVVCHCYHANDTMVRIISARKATVNEARKYREMMI